MSVKRKKLDADNVLKVISNGFHFVNMKNTLVKGIDRRKPRQIVIIGFRDSLF